MNNPPIIKSEPETPPEVAVFLEEAVPHVLAQVSVRRDQAWLLRQLQNVRRPMMFHVFVNGEGHIKLCYALPATLELFT